MRQKGVVPILVIIITVLVVSAVGGVILYFKDKELPDLGFLNNFSEDSQLDEERVVATPTPSPGSNILPVPTPKPSPTVPPLRSITVRGFAYEDRNDDGFFNSDDPKLPNMQFYLYDSYKSDIQISTIYSDTSGNFFTTLNVRGSLIIRPTSYNNFRPRGGQREFSSSTDSTDFGFRSVSAPAGTIGVIEGDVFQDSNRNKTRDSGEQNVYFYKLYLMDSYGSYYNTVRNEQTTDPGGHFKYENLQLGTYILRLSNLSGEYIIDQPETTITLTSTKTEAKNLQIPVYRY